MSKSPDQQELHRQLLTCLRGEWNSLAVVPASASFSASFVAKALVEVSTLVHGAPARYFSTEDLDLSSVSKVIVDMANHVEKGGKAVVCVDSVMGAQSGVPIAISADAALLVVHLGVTTTDDAKNTLEVIGADKFIGAVTLETV